MNTQIKNRLSIKIITILVVFYFFLIDYLNNKGDYLRYEKYKLEQKINLARSKYIETYIKLSRFNLIGELEKEIKKRNLNLIQDSNLFIIYTEKKIKIDYKKQNN